MGAKGAKPQKKNATDLVEEEIVLLLANTHFTRQQIQEWHAGFIVILFVFFCIFTALSQFLQFLIERLSKR